MENDKVNSMYSAADRRNAFIGITDIGQAEDLLNRFQRNNPNDLSGAEQMLDDLLEALRTSDAQLTGSPDSFHNFSVSISKISNDNRDALEIVQDGLKLHPMNTNLLADAIKYGCNCGERDVCASCYQTLQSIDKSRWTWRSFSFSIDYLLDSYSSGGSEVFQDEILELAKSYQRYLPDEEDAWVSEHEVYERFNMHDKGLNTLEDAIKRFRFCPKCWLRYADIMMDNGDYDAAKPVIKNLRKHPKSSDFINISYLFFLDGQCKMAKLMEAENYEDGEIEPAAVLKIYKAFQLSLSSPGLRDATRKQIDEYITRLEKETAVYYPKDWEQ